MTPGLLTGLRVLDFTALLPGPFGTVILADLGADVIKVEPPGGEFGRRFPTQMFPVANRNKRSLCIDLKDPASRPLVQRLAEWADIAVEGFRPGVADRLGIGAAALRAIKPGLVYASLSGYGQTGPWRDEPGHDFNYLAAAGALSLKGHWADAEPHRSGLPVADLAGACYLAIAVLAAVLRARASGEGATLDLSLFEASHVLHHGADGPRRGRAGPAAPASDQRLFHGPRMGGGSRSASSRTGFGRRSWPPRGDLEPRLADPRFATRAGPPRPMATRCMR